MTHVSLWAAVLLLWAIPTSIALVYISSVVVMVSMLLSRQFRPRWAQIRSNAITPPTLALVGITCLGLLYSEASLMDKWRHVRVYGGLLFMLLLLPVFSEAIWRKRAWDAYAAGCAVTVLSSLASVWIQVPWAHGKTLGLGADHSVFNDYISQGLMTAFFVVLCVARSMSSVSRWCRGLWLLMAGLSVFSITHLLSGRTGYLGLTLVLCVIWLDLLNGRRRWLWAALMFGAMGLLAVTSSVMERRIDAGVAQFGAHQSGNDYSSVGARMRMWQLSWNLIGERPVFGHGTATYHQLAALGFDDQRMCKIGCSHPHNQFLFLGVELGVTGVAAYLYFLWVMLRQSRIRSVPERALLLALVALLFMDSFINAPLWLSSERHFFTVLAALILGGVAADPAKRQHAASVVSA